MDQKPEPGRNRYRLRLERLDGWFSYSNLVALGGVLAEARWTTYPNPCKERITLYGPDMPVEVLCLAMDGRMLRN